MFFNYIKITLRNLFKEKMYAVINISGLSLGIACCIILGLFLRSELTYDRHNLNHERIFRIVGEMDYKGVIESWATSPEAWGPLLDRDYPEIEGYVRFKIKGRTLLKYEDKEFFWEKIYLADESVFNVFSHDIIYGDPKTALSDPYSIAVSESFAEKYFGDENPIADFEQFVLNILMISECYCSINLSWHYRFLI
ncbi:MAG: ABC transporter permease [Desulfobacteraceae bacterium]|jgi:putative ABC transport system permease protein